MSTANRAERIISLPAPACAMLRALEEGGSESWIVGGFVRDALRGEASADVDIATAAPWQRASELCEAAGARIVETGTAHGTITAIVDHVPIEITTYRTDGPYRDGRHPDYVLAAASIEEDLARRDFTVNAIAYHPDRGLRDPFHGADDLASGVLRTVGDPRRRFSEDALRILRACRFAAQLGFVIDDGTYRAMQSCKHRLSGIAAERIARELDRMLLGTCARDALLATVDVVAVALPELVAAKGFGQRSPYHCYDVLEHTAWTIHHAPPRRAVRWAALLHDLGKPATFFLDEAGTGHFYGHARVGASIARDTMRRLKMPTAFGKRVVELVSHHDDEIDPTPKAVKRALRAFGNDIGFFRDLCALRRADCLAHHPDHRAGAAAVDELEAIADEIETEHAAFRLGDLAIDGRDVIACGVDRGPAVGTMLQAVLDAVIDEQVENEPAALRAFVRDNVRHLIP